MHDPKAPWSTTEVSEVLKLPASRLTALVYEQRVNVPRNGRGALWYREAAQQAARILGVQEPDRLNALLKIPMHDPPKRLLKRTFCGFLVESSDGMHRYREQRDARTAALAFRARGDFARASLHYLVRIAPDGEVVREEHIPWPNVDKPAVHPEASITEILE